MKCRDSGKSNGAKQSFGSAQPKFLNEPHREVRPLLLRLRALVGEGGGKAAGDDLVPNKDDVQGGELRQSERNDLPAHQVPYLRNPAVTVM